jgi:hypothetical protein
MDHVEAESAEIVSGMATFGTYRIANCRTQTNATIIAVRKVNTPIFTLPMTKNVAQMISIDIGAKMKNATET